MEAVVCLLLPLSLFLNLGLVRLVIRVRRERNLERDRVRTTREQLDLAHTAVSVLFEQIGQMKAAPEPLPSESLSKNDLRRLLALCHPDLHPESRRAEATALSAKINQLRIATDKPKSTRRS
jgi:predicted RNA polymerase sigma factor